MVRQPQELLNINDKGTRTNSVIPFQGEAKQLKQLVKPKMTVKDLFNCSSIQNLKQKYKNMRTHC